MGSISYSEDRGGNTKKIILISSQMALIRTPDFPTHDIPFHRNEKTIVFQIAVSIHVVVHNYFNCCSDHLYSRVLGLTLSNSQILITFRIVIS